MNVDQKKLNYCVPSKQKLVSIKIIDYSMLYKNIIKYKLMLINIVRVVFNGIYEKQLH